MSKLEEFEESLQGGQRANRYRFTITLPNGVAGDVNDLSVLVKSTTIPGGTYGTITINKGGKQSRIKGDEVFDETMDVSIALPKDPKKILTPLKAWWDLKEGYKVESTAELLDINNEVVATFDIKGLWISVFPPISLDDESTDTLLNLEGITFTLDRVEIK